MTATPAEHKNHELRRYRICYIGSTPLESTAEYRIRALKRLGQEVAVLDLSPFTQSNRWIERLRYRYPVGPLVSAINQAALEIVRRIEAELVILDKPIHFTPQTIRSMQAMGAKVVIFMQDNPFGPRNDGCWHQFNRIYRMANLYCTHREADTQRCEQWMLPNVPLMFSYEPSVHFAPEAEWSDAQRSREISYIGHPHEDRPSFLLELGEQYGLPICISGNGWSKLLSPAQEKQFFRGGYLLGSSYREAIWQSKVNLSFVTEKNEDDIAHKAIEVAACGGFLLALRTAGHQARFTEDKEAIFFSDIKECSEKAAYYLAHPEEREAIARAGHRRALLSDYSNDAQMKKLLRYFQ